MSVRNGELHRESAADSPWRVALQHSPLAWLLIGFVRLWRAVISPLYGDVCKFYPSCSAYGLSALETHGALKGSWLITRRLIRCHPWSLGGVDYVPPKTHRHADRCADPHAGKQAPTLVQSEISLESSIPATQGDR